MFGSVCMNHGEPHLFCKSYTLEQVILTSQPFSEKECFKDLMLDHIQDSSLLFIDYFILLIIWLGMILKSFRALSVMFGKS